MRRRGLSGRHVLIIFIGFFATIFAVDGFMIYQAVSTFGGVEKADAYREGLAYNKRIEREVEQSREGWNDETGILPAPKTLRVVLRDRHGSGLAGKSLVAAVGRPATNRYDVKLQLGETSPGVYAAPLPATLGEGTWIVDLQAFEPGAAEPAYESRRRLWIAP
jgi:nitrogen fixation protein FixH